MFALAFRFPAGRYHATPWGRNVNEADVAWPPEPWRILRAFIAAWWLKSDRMRWPKDDLSQLIDTLSETLPEYSVPTGVIHARTRHYMPMGGLNNGRPKTSLVFDAFVRLSECSKLVVAWPRVTLERKAFALGADLASAINYLGRAESWAECEALAEWSEQINCWPINSFSDGDPINSFSDGDSVRLLAPHTPNTYAAERRRLIGEMKSQIRARVAQPLTEYAINAKLDRDLRSKERQAHTLPERLVDALSLDTSDYQNRGWRRPPAAHEVIYVRAPQAAPQFAAYPRSQHTVSRSRRDRPTVARFRLAGRPLPRIEDAIKIGELMRSAALAQFNWGRHESKNQSFPLVPPEISGHNTYGKPLRDPAHSHAFWLPEDSDGDGWIDHVSVFIANGISQEIQAHLYSITRLWLPLKQRSKEVGEDLGGVREWQVALEGFGQPVDFAGSAYIFGRSRRWQSMTPFLASGYLKTAGYLGEVRRLLKRRGLTNNNIKVQVLPNVAVGDTPRRAIHFHRFRSRGKEVQPDTAGALLNIVLPEAIEGPLALGYGSHFGLGLFVPTTISESLQ